jgi:signal-transduction protein with cAMP-binding, CBS, and nucleotidyltransferase domain
MSTRPTSEAGPAEARHAALRRLPLFADLDAEDLAQLDEMASRLLLPAGARFIEEGAGGDALYVILRGEVEISRREGAREIVLATRGGGEFIGEMSLLEQAPRSASRAPSPRPSCWWSARPPSGPCWRAAPPRR